MLIPNVYTKTGGAKYELQIRSFYESTMTGKKTWDEPPSGAESIEYANEEVRRMAELQKKSIESVHVYVPESSTGASTSVNPNGKGKKNKEGKRFGKRVMRLIRRKSKKNIDDRNETFNCDNSNNDNNNKKGEDDHNIDNNDDNDYNYNNNDDERKLPSHMKNSETENMLLQQSQQELFYDPNTDLEYALKFKKDSNTNINTHTHTNRSAENDNNERTDLEKVLAESIVTATLADSIITANATTNANRMEEDIALATALSLSMKEVLPIKK
jgi:hypothetical protein